MSSAYQSPAKQFSCTNCLSELVKYANTYLLWVCFDCSTIPPRKAHNERFARTVFNESLLAIGFKQEGSINLENV